MGDEFIVYSPFLFVFMSAYILLELWRINSFLNRWEISSLSVIPFLFMILYLWIGIFNPEIESARYWLRCVIATSLGIGCYTSFSYSKALRRGGKLI